ncbi:hypothetical protein [Hymenobacter cellulosilyticus]|uniref:hypothetical protein n=1 Tax=Hymenobacter cellulosilyticus TaxID=2932248 RepID=UPI0028802A02|nr:hypothetical protein [Hymenobacter cellulosilyticus]
MAAITSLLTLGACNQTSSPEQGAASATTAASDTTSAQNGATAAMPTSASFGKTSDGTEVQLFTLTNAHGLQATISTYGAS